MGSSQGNLRRHALTEYEQKYGQYSHTTNNKRRLHDTLQPGQLALDSINLADLLRDDIIGGEGMRVETGIMFVTKPSFNYAVEGKCI